MSTDRNPEGLHGGKNSAERVEMTSDGNRHVASDDLRPEQATASPPASGLAIASLVLGLVGFVSYGLTSVLGLVLGLVGMRQIHRSRGMMGGRGLAVAGVAVSATGFTLMFLLLAAIAVPNFLAARQSSIEKQNQTNMRRMEVAQREACMAKDCQLNLRIIETAKEQWSMDNKKEATDAPAAADLRPYVALPSCPSVGTYTIGDMSVPPVCSIGANSSSRYDDHVLQ